MLVFNYSKLLAVWLWIFPYHGVNNIFLFKMDHESFIYPASNGWIAYRPVNFQWVAKLFFNLFHCHRSRWSWYTFRCVAGLIGYVRYYQSVSVPG
jgi:hypothetical protein